MKLPQLQARPQRAERPSMASVRPTDLGLGAVAQEAGAWAAEVRQTQDLETLAQRQDDEAAVAPMVTALQDGFEAKFAEAGANWDGISPGFARTITTDLAQAAAPLLSREDLPPGQRDALQRRLTQYQEATGQRAVAYQAQRRGALAAEQAAARDSGVLGGVMANYATLFGARKQDRDQAYDGSQTGYVEGVLADHDAVAADLIEAAPPQLQPRVTQQLAARRLQLQAGAMDFEAQAEQGFVANQVRSSAALLVNGVLTAPSLYDSSVADVDQVVAALPAGARAGARAGLLNDLTEAYIGGLVRDKRHDQALDLLNSGRLDARLNPATKARLIDGATRARDGLDTDDWLARLSLQQKMEDDIASRASTGVGVDGVDATRIAETLGPREAAQYLQAVQAAEQTHAGLAGYAQMTPAQIREQVAGLAPVPGQAGFAEAQALHQVAVRAAEAEISKRAEDPAAWAIAATPSLGAALSGLGTGADAATARRNAGAYAVGQLTLQETAGVPAAERRLLPKGVAAQLVTAQTQNPDPAEGLIGLGQVIRAFAPPDGAGGATITAAMARQRMVINELKAAGADNGDIAAAVDLSNDPVRMGRYVAASRGGQLAAMDRKDREELTDAVDRELTPYLRSFEAVSVSASLTGGRRLMAHRLAAEARTRDGGSVRDAARAAAEVVAGNYEFVGPQGFRVPRSAARGNDVRDIQRGASGFVSNLAANDGAGFYAPADNGAGLSEAQRRERYADAVTLRGRWMTTPDDGGLVLMHPTVDGRWTAALDRNGRAIQRTWGQLSDDGSGRSTAAATRQRNSGGGGGRAALGIRNHNPGNIEARRGTTWQGQVGDDGRFVRFATPEHGLRALSRDLGTKMGRGLRSVRAILTEYAPPSDNNTAAYIAAVARAMGVDPNEPLRPDDVVQRAALMGAIVSHENGGNPYAPALIAEGARQGMRR